MIREREYSPEELEREITITLKVKNLLSVQNQINRSIGYKQRAIARMNRNGTKPHLMGYEMSQKERFEALYELLDQQLKKNLETA